MILQFHEKDFVLRTPESHDRMCDHLEISSDPVFDSTTYGINRKSSLSSLKFYHICDFGLPPDVMHDLLEGYVPYKVKLMLTHFIEEGLLTLQDINTRIKNFRYCYMETKPTVLFPMTFSSSGAQLNQSGIVECMLIALGSLCIAQSQPSN